MTNLEKLNILLQNPKLNIPVFRQTVSSSFANLKWLQDKLVKNPNCSDEIKHLLKMDPKTLLGNYENKAKGSV